MDFKVAGLNPASFAETLDFQKSSAEVAPISLQDIRSLRHGFEREAETLRPVLGAAEHPVSYTHLTLPTTGIV